MTKTFLQIRTEVPEASLYPEEISDLDKALIADWFDDRHVNDDDKFCKQFKRQISKEYGQYLQLVRIDPDHASYDWLVQNYKESLTQAKRTPNLSTVTTGNVTGTKTIGLEEGRQVTDGGTESHDRNGYDLHTQNVTETDSGSVQEYSNAQNPVQKTTVRTHPGRKVKSAVSSDATTHTSQGEQNVNLSKNNPMSISYANGVVGQGQMVGHADWVDTEAAGVGSATTPILDWHTASTQDETNRINNSFTHDISDPTKNYTETDETYSGTDQDVVTDAGEHDKDHSNTKVYTGEKDRAEYNSGNVTTFGKTVNTTMNIDTSITDGKDSNTTVAQTGVEDAETKVWYTGRQEAPADILERAKKFIESTCAFDFLYERLNVCFAGFYDV